MWITNTLAPVEPPKPVAMGWTTKPVTACELCNTGNRAFVNELNIAVHSKSKLCANHPNTIKIANRVDNILRM